MDKEEVKKAISDLKKYPEYFVLKQQLLKMCDELESISDLKIDGVSRVTLETEIYGRLWASEKVRNFLADIGMIQDMKAPKIKTFE